MLRYCLLAFVMISPLSSLSLAEEIDVKWEISANRSPDKKAKAFSAKTKLPRGATVTVIVTKMKDSTSLVFLDPESEDGLPKINPLKAKGDKVTTMIGEDGKLTLLVPLSVPTKSDKNMLSFDSGLTLQVVIEK